jgi:outer membrane protein assembly factor BamE (lipoprotein component of BamABCDE complex)
MRTNSRLRLTAALLLTAAVSAGCAERIATRGNMPAADIVEALQPGTQTKDQVLQLLGSPSNIGTFNDNTWYYIGVKTEQMAFFKPKAIEQQVLQIKFDSTGVVNEVRRLGLEDAQQVALADKETPTAGKELGFFEQLFGNVGRFNTPRGNLGGQNRRPGGPQGGL